MIKTFMNQIIYFRFVKALCSDQSDLKGSKYVFLPSSRSKYLLSKRPESKYLFKKSSNPPILLKNQMDVLLVTFYSV